MSDPAGRGRRAPPAIARRFPEPLHTPRLVIRRYVLSDAPALFAAVNRSRASLLQFMPWARSSHLVIADTEEWITRERARWLLHDTELGFGLFKQDASFVGGIGLHAIDWSVPRFELGYWLDDPSAGSGYMQEAVRAMARACFGACHAARVEIRCDVRNWRSARVAEACGFRLDGTLRGHVRGTDGSIRDTMVWGMTALDHDAVRAGWDAADVRIGG